MNVAVDLVLKTQFVLTLLAALVVFVKATMLVILTNYVHKLLFLSAQTETSARALIILLVPKAFFAKNLNALMYVAV